MRSNFFIVLIFTLLSFNSFGQSCGIYKVRITGKISETEKIFDSISIPKIRFFDIQNINGKGNYIKIEIVNNKFNLETNSNLTSNLYDNANDLKKHFIENRKDFPIVLYEKINGRKKKINIDWEKIEIKKIENKEFGRYFEIDLKEINAESK